MDVLETLASKNILLGSMSLQQSIDDDIYFTDKNFRPTLKKRSTAWCDILKTRNIKTVVQLVEHTVGMGDEVLC